MTNHTSASKSCADLAAWPATAAQLRQSVTQALRYAACMRSHGITTFQASTDGDHVRMGFQGGGAEANSTHFLIAQRICKPLLPNLLGES